jgi:AraC-like DNA-binding protein
LIKSELGVGVRRLKQHYRFKLVARAAAEGKNLTAAAHAAGFADSGHFSRTFLETFGLSPSKVLLRGAGTDFLT